ncbi:hypothetical protein [Microbacterium aurantiacum]|uniref:hypothetical protein n=1 Tax=Microbacterium aurantiacum TaxID=162393 RepID=UPI0031D548D8
MSALSEDRSTSPAATVGGGLVVALAGGMIIAALIIGLVVETDWTVITRLLVTAVVYAPVAAVILPYRRPLLAAITSALSVTSAALALIIVMVDAGAGPASLVPGFAMLARQPEIAAIAVLPWLLVRRRRARRAGVALGGVAILVDLCAWAGVFAGLPVPRWILTGSLVIALLSLLGATVVLVGQWRRGDARERAVLSWFAVGALLLVVSYLRLMVPLPNLPAALADAAFLVAQSILPTAVLAIVFGRAVSARRGTLLTTVAWAQSLAFAVALYLIVDAVATSLGAPATLAGAIAAGVLALAFGAVRRVVLDLTGRLLFDADADARTVLRRLGERVGQPDTARGGLEGIAESLRAAWQLGAVEISVAGEPAAVVVGTPGGARISATLVARGRSIGTIELSGPDEAHLRSTVGPVLDEVAPLVAVAVLMAVVNQEVDLVRTRALGVAREERRRLHRELRDELVPSLAGIGFAMAGTERLMRLGDRAAAERSLREIRGELAERAEGVRLLARSLLPAALDAGDLDGALRELAQRLGVDGGAVTVDAPGVDVLGERAQIAVYVLAAEAVTRLRRAGRLVVDIRVRLVDDGAAVRLRVSSPAVAGQLRADVGDALSRRAAEAGGTVETAGADDSVWTAVIPR